MPTDRHVWRPLSKSRADKLVRELSRALVPLLSGPDAAATAREIVDALTPGTERDVFAVVAGIADAEVDRATIGALVGLYLRHAVDDDQREESELLGDAGVPFDLVEPALELVRELQKGRAA